MRHLTSVLLALLLLASCQKELCYHHPHGPDSNHGRLHVSFLWDDTTNPEAEEMHLVAFAGGINPVIYPFGGMDGGEVLLWPGQYWFVAYNSDTETTTTRGTTYDTFEICGVDRNITRSIKRFIERSEFLARIPTRSGAAEDNEEIVEENLQFIWEPERVWVSTEQDYAVVAHTDQELPMNMWAATYQYTFLIHNVANLHRVSDISASLSGLASCYRPSERRPLDFTVSEFFTFTKVDESTIRGSLRVFGHSPEEGGATDISQGKENLLTLYVTMDLGTRYCYQYTVTEDMINPTSSSIDAQTGEIIINIKIDDIPIPEQPTAPAGSFDIGIDDFITEEWDIFP